MDLQWIFKNEEHRGRSHPLTLLPQFEVRFGTVKGNSCSSTLLKNKSKVSSTNLRDKLQFVNSVKGLISDLPKITFLKRLITISCLIIEVSMIRIFLQNQIWLIGFRVMCSFVQVVISQNELKLLGSVEK